MYTLISSETVKRNIETVKDMLNNLKKRFLDEYIEIYDEAISFAKEFWHSLWCYGNHDLCYLWNEREFGYSKVAKAYGIK